DRRGRPLPDVAGEVEDAEGARALGVGLHGIGLAGLGVAAPACDAVLGRLVAPRVGAAVGAPRGLLPLLLCQQIRRDPAAVLDRVRGGHSHDGLLGPVEAHVSPVLGPAISRRPAERIVLAVRDGMLVEVEGWNRARRALGTEEEGA